MVAGMSERASSSAVIRKAFCLFLRPGCEDEYERRHRPIWPELQATLRTHGVLTYSIFLDPTTRVLFAYAELESEERWNAIAATPVCREWWRHMAELMETNPDLSPRSRDLPEVFHLEGKLGSG
jgi:L-rhamnose mutarotase